MVKCTNGNGLRERILRPCRKAGFTLAEVLITLGIIGVVAAMVIPSLISNINATRFRTQFKKTLATLNQAGKMSQAQYGFSFGDINTHDYGCGVEGAGACCINANPENIYSICSLINGTINKVAYAEMIEEPYYSIYSNNGVEESLSQPIWILSDGSLFTSEADMCKTPTLTGKPATPENLKSIRYCRGWIDVNGIAQPNKIVSCSDGKATKYLYEDDVEPCVVSNDSNHLTDIFPVLFYDSNVIPATNAAQYVLNNTK